MKLQPWTSKKRKVLAANTKYPLRDLIRARSMYRDGHRIADIARKIKVPASIVQQAIKGRRRFGKNLPYRGLTPLELK